MSGSRSARWVGRRVIQEDGLRIGTVAEIYDQTARASWALVRERRFGGRRRVVPIDEARSTHAGVVVPYSRDAVRGAPVIAHGAPDAREAERLAVYYRIGDEAPPPLTTPPKPPASAELTQAIAEARYCEDRLRLYRAKLYRGAAVSDQRMRELERAHEGAKAQLRRVRARSAVEPKPPER